MEKYQIILHGEDNKKIDSRNYFEAVIIGKNGSNLVVKPLEEEEIRNSSDLFSFSISGDKDYQIGQKVKIKYTGEIMESYPAKITVLEITNID